MISADRVKAIRADLDRRAALKAELAKYTHRAIGERNCTSYQTVWSVAQGDTRHARAVRPRQYAVRLEEV